MQKKQYKILFGIAMYLLFITAGPVFANGVKVEEFQNVEEYLDETAHLLEEYPCDYHKNPDRYPYQSKRLIVVANHVPETYGAVDAIAYEASCILQYDTEAATREAYGKLAARYGKENVFPDEEVEATAFAQEIPAGSNIWGIQYMGLDHMQEVLAQSHRTLPNIKVAVIDSGVTASNPWLQGRLDLENAKDVTQEGDVPISDATGHGSHVTGIIVAGSSDNVKVLPVKIADATGKMTVASTRAGVLYALEKNVDVLNFSFCSQDNNLTTSYLDDLIDQAVDQDVVICAAAGNYASDALYAYPGNHPEVMCIGGMDSSGRRPSSSNNGDTIDFVAPSVNIDSTVGDSFGTKSGTSMAAPHITAAVAMLKTYNPALRRGQIYNELNSYSRNLQGYDTTGNIYKSVNLSTYIKDHCAHEMEEHLSPATQTTDGTYYTKCKYCDQSSEIVEISRVNSISLVENQFAYTGQNISPSLIVKDANGKVLAAGTDYDVQYPNGQKDAGSHILKVILKGKYQGSKELAFQISKAKPISVTLGSSVYTYNGKAKTPSVKVTASGNKTLIKNTDYTVTYPSGRVTVGYYTVTIKMKGNYQGNYSRRFKINPKSVTFGTPTLRSKTAILRWNKQTAQTTGYQIKFANNASFTSYKLYTVAGNTKTSYTVKNLVKGRKYYAMIRTYKKVNGTLFYSAWSKVKVFTAK